MIMKAPISSKCAHSKTQVLLIAQYRLSKLRSVGNENTLELKYLANDRKTLDLNKLEKNLPKIFPSLFLPHHQRQELIQQKIIKSKQQDIPNIVFFLLYLF